MVIANRTIWTTWYQGLDQARPLVRHCVDSWRRLNPDWNVIVVDKDSLREWIDLEEVVDLQRRDITPQRLSSFIRLSLLKRYGGVWFDATVFCLRPLDCWLPEYASSGFFAFRNPAPDRLFSSWFLAAEVGNPILDAFHAAYVEFMSSRTFSNQDTLYGRAAIKLLRPILSRNVRRTIHWLDPRLQTWLRAYPYLIMHYTFNKTILTNPDLRFLWEQSRSLDAGPAHSLQVYAHEADGLAKALDMLARKTVTLQKLDWRIDLAHPYWRGVFHRLLDSLPSQ